MAERVEIVLYSTNHSLRATTVTVLAAKNLETRIIKAITQTQVTQGRFQHQKLLQRTTSQPVQGNVINPYFIHPWPRNSKPKTPKQLHQLLHSAQNPQFLQAIDCWETRGKLHVVTRQCERKQWC